jgi:hypothetical protein
LSATITFLGERPDPGRTRFFVKRPRIDAFELLEGPSFKVDAEELLTISG